MYHEVGAPAFGSFWHLSAISFLEIPVRIAAYNIDP
jgi:hypothetical protein